MRKYEPEFKREIVRLYLESGRTRKSIASEYKVSTTTITTWVNEFKEESQSNPEIKQEYDIMAENLKLRKELEETKKELLFLKKVATFFATENQNNINL